MRFLLVALALTVLASSEALGEWTVLAAQRSTYAESALFSSFGGGFHYTQTDSTPALGAWISESFVGSPPPGIHSRAFQQSMVANDHVGFRADVSANVASGGAGSEGLGRAYSRISVTFQLDEPAFVRIVGTLDPAYQYQGPDEYDHIRLRQGNTTIFSYSVPYGLPVPISGDYQLPVGEYILEASCNTHLRSRLGGTVVPGAQEFTLSIVPAPSGLLLFVALAVCHFRRYK
jgi:hypothetical protein